jgi:urease accessory protein
MSLIPLLLLADGRLPSGTHAHSGGLEAAVRAGRVDDADTLQSFLLGRLTTAGLTAAAFAAATALELADGILATAGGGAIQPKELALLDAEYDARTPSPAQREVSRRLGRQLVRAARAGWPSPVLEAASLVHPDGPHQPIAFGAAAAAAGIDPQGTAAAAALGSVTGPAGAATRLLGLDPDEVTAVLAGLTEAVDEIAAAAMRAARGPAEELPALSAPLLDISAEQHLTWEVRLFAS